MDSGITPNVSRKCEVICNGEVNLGYLSTVDMDTTGKLLKPTSEKHNTALLLPVTPDSAGEKKARDSQYVLNSPLISHNPKLHEKSCLDYYGGGLFHTPIAEIVDPSAAAANLKLIQDPDESRKSAARTLDFGSETRVQQGNDIVLSDEEMVESVYENLLTVILSNKIEDAANIEFIDDGCKTPVPCLTGIAETCPGAPLKAAMKKTRRRIDRDSSLCRKLEF